MYQNSENIKVVSAVASQREDPECNLSVFPLGAPASS